MRKILAVAVLIACTFGMTACVKKKADPLKTYMNSTLNGSGAFNLPYCYAEQYGSTLYIKGTATVDGNTAPYLNFILANWSGGIGTCQLSAGGSTGATMVLAMNSDGSGSSLVTDGLLTITYINGPEMRGTFTAVLFDGTKLTNGSFVAERR